MKHILRSFKSAAVTKDPILSVSRHVAIANLDLEKNHLFNNPAHVKKNW